MGSREVLGKGRQWKERRKQKEEISSPQAW